MKYLDCIELLNLAYQLLRPEQRDQVPVSKLMELEMLVNQAYRRTDSQEVRTMLSDISAAVGLARQNAAIQYLPANMKEAFVAGIQKCMSTVCELAWAYYMEHDVPEDQEALLRIVVEYHFLQGDDISDC